MTLTGTPTQLWARTLKYGMTAEERHAIYLAQGGACAICRREMPEVRLVVDHDHRCCSGITKTCGMCRRGLLCPSCNNRLTGLEDEAFAAAATTYLARFTAGLWCRKGHRLEPMPSGACRACARVRSKAYHGRKRARDFEAHRLTGLGWPEGDGRCARGRLPQHSAGRVAP